MQKAKFIRKLPKGSHPIWKDEYLAGRTLSEIAQRYGVSRQAVVYNLNYQGVETRPLYSEEVIQRWIDLYNQGKRIYQIQEITGTRAGSRTIRKHLKLAGVQTKTHYFQEKTRGEESYKLRLEGRRWDEIGRIMNYSEPNSALKACVIAGSWARRRGMTWPLKLVREISEPKMLPKNPDLKTKQAWAQAYRDGKSISVIAGRIWENQEVVRKALIELKVKSKRGLNNQFQKTKVLKKEVDLWRKYIKEGFSIKEISKKTEKNESTVRNNLRKKGVIFPLPKKPRGTDLARKVLELRKSGLSYEKIAEILKDA